MAKKYGITFLSHNRIIISCLLASLCGGTALHSETADTMTRQAPRLIVGITVDGLSLDYLDLLEDYFVDNGLRQVIEDGVTFTDVDFGTTLDAVACNAILYTGAAPTINGISGEYVYDSATHRAIPLLNRTSPSAADENFSPSALLSTTLSDELKIAGSGLGHVHSIAPDASMAIVAAGHSANSAFWINDVSGKWTTSTYYEDRPVFLQYRNRMQPVNSRLDTLVWKPVTALSKYPGLNTIQKEYPFSVRFPYGDAKRYNKYKASPTVNDEVTDVAIEYIRNLELGTHEQPDMLSIAYTLQPYPYGASQADEKMQTIDGYYRLDRNLQRLLQTIGEGVGMDNTLMFIVGTPVAPRSRRDDEKWRIPTGEFSPKKAISLLNLYLINKFGNGEWISGFNEGFFYVNPATVAEHGVAVEDVRTEAASFLKKMQGVAYAYTIDDIADRRIHDNALAESRNVRHDASGDIRVTVAPGWHIADDNSQTDNSLVERAGQTTAPAFILFPSLQKETITKVVDARSLAPTLASVLRIRAPNGASLPPVRLKRTKKS